MREQYVKVNDHTSYPRILQCGVPQGTVLGPLLFLIYINDLCNINTGGKVISYADDTALIFTGKNFNEARQNSEKGLQIIFKWLNNNLLTLNLDKTVFLTFSSYDNAVANRVNLKIHHSDCPSNDHPCNCYNINKVSSVKYLGIIVDHHLNWKEHIKFISNKLRAVSYKFYRLRPILNKANLKLMYYAFAQSYLLYGILGWGGVSKFNLKPLELVQKSIIKTILRRPRTYPSIKVFAEFKVCSVRNLFLKMLMLHTFKFKIFSFSLYDTRLSSSSYIKIPTMLTSLGQRQGSYLGPKIFNLLPSNLSRLDNYKDFKKQLCIWIHSLSHNHWNTFFN